MNKVPNVPTGEGQAAGSLGVIVGVIVGVTEHTCPTGPDLD